VQADEGGVEGTKGLMGGYFVLKHPQGETGEGDAIRYLWQGREGGREGERSLG